MSGAGNFLIVDDHPLFIEALQRAIKSAMPQATTVEASSIETAKAELQGRTRFDLVLLAAQRAREISGGGELTIDRDRDKNPVVALREIAEQTISPKDLHESLVTGLQKILPDDEDDADEIGSLSQSAEALRITASAPARSTSIGSDYDG